jgi:hypothetical protein
LACGGSVLVNPLAQLLHGEDIMNVIFVLLSGN